MGLTHRTGNTTGKRLEQHHPALPKGQACANCKRRKVRCSAGTPACQACIRTARHDGLPPELVVCHYTGKEKKGKVLRTGNSTKYAFNRPEIEILHFEKITRGTPRPLAPRSSLMSPASSFDPTAPTTSPIAASPSTSTPPQLPLSSYLSSFLSDSEAHTLAEDVPTHDDTKKALSFPFLFSLPPPSPPFDANFATAWPGGYAGSPLFAPTMASPDAVASLAATLEQLSSAGPERDGAEANLNAFVQNHTSSAVLALVQIGQSNPTEALRAHAFILLRRFLFRPLPNADFNSPLSREVWDLLDEATRSTMQASLLQSLLSAAGRKEKERGVICDLVAAVENAGGSRGGTRWPSLVAALTQIFASPELALREACFRIYSECVVSLLESEPTPSVIAGLSVGLRDPATGVRIAALKAAVNLIKNAESPQLEEYAPLAAPMLDILPPLAAEHADARLTEALLPLIDLASTPKVPSRIFKAHLASLLSFSLSILTPSPFKTSANYSPTPFDDTVRMPALELLLSIAETAPSMSKAFGDFTRKLVPTLMNLMAEIEDDPDWLNSEQFNDDDNESMAVVAEGSVDRLSQALGDCVFAPFVQALTPLLNSLHWQCRHAGLSTIASIAEGCPDQILENLTFLKTTSLRSMKDPHPRVRYAAVYAIGQLCTDLDGAVQEEFGEEILKGLIEVTKGPEPRLQAYGAAALVNFFQTADMDLEPLEPVLAEVFEQLVNLLTNGTNFVKQNALEAMALLAAFMDNAFTVHYAKIMPQLLHLLESGSDPSLVTLRAKAIDCAAQIASSVDSSVAAPDAPRLLVALHNIRVSLADPDDSETMPYLLAGFARLAETVGPEIFAPYVADCFTQLMEAAQRKPDMTIGAADEDEEEDDEWESVEVNGDVVAIRTSALEEKAEAVRHLVILVQSISSILPPEALQSVLQVAEPLLKFYFHVGVRESASALIAVAVQGLSKAQLSQEQRNLVMNAVSDAYAQHVAADTDPEFVSLLIASWTSCFISLPGCLAPDARERFLKALEAQLTQLTARDRQRREAGEVDEDDVVELEESAEGDAMVYPAINGALSALLQAEGAALPLGPFIPFLGLVVGPSPGPTHFALRLISDIVEYTGEASPAVVQPYLERVLNALGDADNLTRRIASYVVGVAAATAPIAYLDFCKAAIEPLFHGASILDMNNNSLLAARDNAVSALSKIIRNLGDQVNGEALLPRWVAALPVFVDPEEMSPVYGLLLELIARGHPSVSPTTDVASHVTKVLVSALENSDLPASLHRPMAQALKTYVSSIPGGQTIQIPAHVEAKVVALLE